jgi:heme oxygenase
MILHNLREQTHESHRQLEVRLDLLPATLSLDRYRSLLARFYGFYVPVEINLAGLCQHNAPELQFSRRCKVNLLIRDLEALGLSRQQITELPLCDNGPTLTRFPQALGCLYVLEGATLGGQLIARHLESIHGIHQENGGAFFRSYGLDVGMMWRAFGAALTSYVGVQGEEPIIIRAACDTFARLETWLCDE